MLIGNVLFPDADEHDKVRKLLKIEIVQPGLSSTPCYWEVALPISHWMILQTLHGDLDILNQSELWKGNRVSEEMSSGTRLPDGE